MNRKINRRNAIRNVALSCTGATICGYSIFAYKERKQNGYKNRLFTPTQITKIGSQYFIVDCWQHRVIYSKNIRLPISQWSVLDDNLAGPHSIASNGKLYVTEDTGRHAIKVYSADNSGNFHLNQTLGNVGVRPHRTLYDTATKNFLVVGANDQSIHFFSENGNGLEANFQKNIKELNGEYCRSITIKNNVIYFIGINRIVSYFLRKHSLGKLNGVLMLHRKYRESNDLYFTKNGAGYFTATPGKFFSFKSIFELSSGDAIDHSREFTGTPYYLDEFDDQLWIPEITEYSKISSVPIENSISNLSRRTTLFDIGPPNGDSIRRKLQLPF